MYFFQMRFTGSEYSVNYGAFGSTRHSAFIFLVNILFYLLYAVSSVKESSGNSLLLWAPEGMQPTHLQTSNTWSCMKALHSTTRFKTAKHNQFSINMWTWYNVSNGLWQINVSSKFTVAYILNADFIHKYPFI